MNWKKLLAAAVAIALVGQTTVYALDQLSKGDPDGTKLGQSATDKLGFYGATTVVQPSGAAQAALTVTGGGANILTAALTPANVAANTCAEQTFTVTGVGTDQVIVVNKPTAQAGLGIGGVRASAANQVGITFCNNTGSVITPTAGQTYSFAALGGASDATLALVNALRSALVTLGLIKGSS